ncbi:MAG TPA: TonB-dependent receptor, partial [Pyrinomonadaceae bacterium]
PNWFNEFRYQFQKDREPGLANSTAPEATFTASAGGITDGTFNIGRNNFSPRETTITRNQFIDSQTYISGNHTIKYGADLLFDQIFNFFPGLFTGSYTFTNYTALSNQLATPGTQFASRFRQSFAGSGTTGATTHPNNHEYGFFFQDDWRASQKLTLNLGIRWDYQSIAKPQIQNPNAALLAAGFDTSFRPSDKNNFAPRVGISYAFNEKTVIRGGYGMYYGRTPAIMTGTAHSQNGIQVIAIDVNCVTAPASCPLYPNIFSAAPSGATLAPINLYLFSKQYKQPFTHQARVQFEREVWKNTTFSVQYELYKGVDLSRTRDANLPAPTPTTFPIFDASGNNTGQTVTVQRFVAARPIPAFNRISLFESSARSLYNGVSFSLNRRFSNHWQFDANYTISKAKDDKPDQTSVVVGADDAKVAQNQFDLSGEYGTSDLDMRHRFVFDSVYDTGKFTRSDSSFVKALLSDYVFTWILQVNSGIAYSAAVSGDPNNDGNTSNDRTPGSLRNQFYTPSAKILDMRVGRGFRLGERSRITLFAEGFNIFNTANVISVNNTQYTFSAALGRFTQTTNFKTPRQFYSGSPSFSLNNSSYNREFQLGARFDF